MTIIDDNKARARELAANWYENEQGIDNYIAPLVSYIADALASAELRGRIEGLKEARKIADWHGSSGRVATVCAIDARLASLQPEVAKREEG